MNLIDENKAMLHSNALHFVNITVHLHRVMIGELVAPDHRSRRYNADDQDNMPPGLPCSNIHLTR